MSDTPETDGELAELGFGFYTMGGLPADAVCVEFARKLERERDSAIKNASNNLHHYVKANLRVEEIKSERDLWKAEAERWRDWKMS